MKNSKAKWMEAKKEFETPIIRKTFELNDYDSGVIRICGLGFFELFINGTRVSEDYFKPAWTDYGYRPLTKILYPISNNFRYRRYYLEYDISKLLIKGQNVLTVMLGNGWYRQNKRNIEGDLFYDEKLKLWFDLECVSKGKAQHIVSDESLVQAQSHIVLSNVYFGEKHDYTNYSDLTNPNASESGFVPMQTANETGFIFEKQPCGCDAVIRTITPVEITKPTEIKKSRARIFDCKENISGWAVISGARGDIRISYAEEINDDGSLNFLSAGGDDQISRDEYISTSQEMTLRPVFHWNAFRYFMVKGDFLSVDCEVVHQKVAELSDYDVGDERLKWFYDTYKRTQLNNFHCGVPSDCPHRERLAYTGDGWLTAQAAMMLFDVADFYKKWIRDIFDCQDPLSGHVRHTAPFYGGGGGPGGWGGAIVLMPYFYYNRYKDKDFLREAFPHIKKYLSCMESFSKDGFIIKEIEGGWCLGDWCTHEAVKLPESFVNTFFYIKLMKIADEIAEILGEAALFKQKIIVCTDAFTNTFYDVAEKTFCGGVQGADIFACELGLDGLVSFDKTAQRYAQTKRFDTGIFGTYFLIKNLCERGKADIAFELIASEEYPSFGFMKQKGATTLWESWDGGMSHDHPMFGGCIYFLLQEKMGEKQ